MREGASFRLCVGETSKPGVVGWTWDEQLSGCEETVAMSTYLSHEDPHR